MSEVHEVGLKTWRKQQGEEKNTGRHCILQQKAANQTASTKKGTERDKKKLKKDLQTEAWGGRYALG